MLSTSWTQLQSHTPRKRLDHYPLNEIEGLKNPSSENINHRIWHRLKPTLPPFFMPWKSPKPATPVAFIEGTS